MSDAVHDLFAAIHAHNEDGVRLLVYAGNADMMCNFMVRPVPCAAPRAPC